MREINIPDGLSEKLDSIEIKSPEEVIRGMSRRKLDTENWKDGDGEPFYITQEKWIPKYNEAGRVMACAADYYHAAQNGDSAIPSVQEDFKRWVMTSTRIIYNKESLDAEIIDYIGSTVVDEERREIVIPDYSGWKLVTDALDTKEGLRFFQALYRTEDDKDDILRTLKLLGGVDRVNIITPGLSLRRSKIYQTSNMCRPVSFKLREGVFNINIVMDPNNCGRSRGVRI